MQIQLSGKAAEIVKAQITILRGSLPHRAKSMVIEWAALHQQELMQNWESLHNDQPAQRIEPLD